MSAQSMTNIADGLRAISTVDTSNAANLRIMTDGLSKLGGGDNIQAAANALPKLAAGLRSFANIKKSWIGKYCKSWE